MSESLNKKFLSLTLSLIVVMLFVEAYFVYSHFFSDTRISESTPTPTSANNQQAQQAPYLDYI